MIFKKNELFRASFILLILVNISNFLNYAFHIIMVWLLGVNDYGVLAFLTNIIYIFSVPSTAIQTLVSQRATRLKVNEEFGKMKGLLMVLIKKMFIISLVLFIIFSVLSYLFSKELGIPLSLLLLTGGFLFAAFIPPIGTGILQGMKKFGAWGSNVILNSIVKLIIAVILVIAGFGVYGPIIGFFLSAFVAFIFIFPFIKEVINVRVEREEMKIFSGKTLVPFFGILFIVLMYTSDVLIAKGLFSQELAGKYSFASLMGKMILFGSLSITNAMFPISSEKFENGSKEKTRNIIKKSFMAITFLCSSAILVIILFPKFLITVLSGFKYAQYAGIESFLIFVGLAFFFIALSNTLIFYRISVNEFKMRDSITLFLFLILQISLLFIFGNNAVYFSISFMVSCIITFISLLFLNKLWKK